MELLQQFSYVGILFVVFVYRGCDTFCYTRKI